MKKIFFTIVIISFFVYPAIAAGSKYSDEFKKNFSQCTPYTEKKYNVSYNSNSTYEIKGYMQDGSERCIYVETNEWLRGKNVTTCLFSPKQLQEYLNAMITPDTKHSANIGAMPVVGGHEEVVFLKYFNNPEVCKTIGTKY